MVQKQVEKGTPTLPKTNIALEKEWLEDAISFRFFFAGNC